MATWLFFFFLGKIPSTLWLLIALLGVGGYFAAGVLSRIGPFKAYSVAIKPLSILIAVFGVYMYGGASINDHYAAMIKEMEAKIAVAEAQSTAVNERIEERVQTQIQVVRDNQVIYQDRIIEVTPEIDAQCILPPVVPSIHNDAARYPFIEQMNKAARGEKK